MGSRSEHRSIGIGFGPKPTISVFWLLKTIFLLHFRRPTDLFLLHFRWPTERSNSRFGRFKPIVYSPLIESVFYYILPIHLKVYLNRFDRNSFNYFIMCSIPCLHIKILALPFLKKSINQSFSPPYQYPPHLKKKKKKTISLLWYFPRLCSYSSFFL